ALRSVGIAERQGIHGREGEAMHYLGLEGRAALVTGGSAGIGRAISEELGRAGVAVGVNYHSGRENADEVVQGIEAEGGRAIALGADVSDQDACRAMFKAFVERFGRLDILVANSRSEEHTSELQSRENLVCR